MSSEASNYNSDRDKMVTFWTSKLFKILIEFWIFPVVILNSCVIGKTEIDYFLL